VNVSALVLVAGFGLNDVVTPAGRPDVAARVTLPVNTPCGVMVMLLFPLPPCGTVAGDTGEAERLKSGVTTAITLSIIVVV
jgi:hypothetical protein